MIQGQAFPPLKDVTIEDLLGRDEIPSDPQLWIRKFVPIGDDDWREGPLTVSCVMKLKHEPRRLILFEIGEFSLYQLQQGCLIGIFIFDSVLEIFWMRKDFPEF